MNEIEAIEVFLREYENIILGLYEVVREHRAKEIENSLDVIKEKLGKELLKLEEK